MDIGLDTPQGFLKAMLDVYPISGISKNLASLPVNAPYDGKPDGSMKRQMFACPVVRLPPSLLGALIASIYCLYSLL